MRYECNEASLTPNVDLDECNQGGSVPMNQWGGKISVHVGDLQTFRIFHLVPLKI